VTIFFVFLTLLRGGAFILVHALGFEIVSASAKDRSDRLLARGLVAGNVEQVAGGTGLHTTELVDQGLAGRPREERADDASTTSERELHRFENLRM